MERLLVILTIFLVFFSCKKNQNSNQMLGSDVNLKLVSFGDSISINDVLDKKTLLSKYRNLNKTDTLTVKFKSTIKEVCSKKGCWMKLELDSLNDVMVRFKNYSFFMPLNSSGSEVIIEGKAFIKETSVEELKHYAEDAGKSKQAIDSISEPKFTYSIVSNGVLLKK